MPTKPIFPKVSSLSKAPGQHEDQIARLGRIEDLLKRPIKIEFKCSCCADTQKEILTIVRDIQSKLGGDFANRATKEEVEEILGPVLVKLKAVH